MPVLALLGLVGCEYPDRGDGRYGGYGNRGFAYPSDGYYNGPYADRYGGYRRNWRGRDWDDRKRDSGDERKRQKQYTNDDWKERRYERMKDNGRREDAERFNNRLCRNGVAGDAPGGC